MRERRNIECTKRRTQSHYSGSSGAGVKINRIGPIIPTNELLFSLDLITAVSPMSVAIRICISDIWDKCTALLTTLYKLNIMSNLPSFQPNLMRKLGAGKRRERGLRIRPFDWWTYCPSKHTWCENSRRRVGVKGDWDLDWWTIPLIANLCLSSIF